MAATVIIVEQNGAGAGSETTVTNSNMGSTDAANLTAASYPITAGQNSYEKWQRFKVTDISTSSAIKTFKVWVSGALASGATLYTSATPDIGLYVNPSPYCQPVATASATADMPVPTSAPTIANVGYNGNLATANGGITATGLYSDYVVWQIKTSTDATAGTTVTLSYQYDEIA